MTGPSAVAATRDRLPFSKWWLLVLGVIVVILCSLAWAFIAAPTTPSPDFQAFVVPVSSMEPTILKGDHIIADMYYYRQHKAKDRDIIIFETLGTIAVKRIIASGGETIRGSGGAVFVNDKLVLEPYAQHIGNALQELNEFGPVRVQSDSYFVMGDNRDLSLDSRSADLGCIPAGAIVGRPIRVLFNWHSGRIGKSIH